MLKISVINGRTQRRLVIEGKLIAPWVEELRTACQEVKAVLEGRELVIEVANVSVISQEGEKVLLELMNEGARFRCTGVLTKHIVQQLARRSRRARSELQRGRSPEEEGQ